MKIVARVAVCIWQYDWRNLKQMIAWVQSVKYSTVKPAVNREEYLLNWKVKIFLLQGLQILKACEFQTAVPFNYFTKFFSKHKKYGNWKQCDSWFFTDTTINKPLSLATSFH